MKKVNKALMATVAILLSLVLISTSVLSGVFAKFVETKSAGATVSLKAFGLTLTVSSNDKYNPVYTPSADNAISVTVPITMNAATKYDDIVIFTITANNPSVDNAKLILKMEISGVSNFAVSDIVGIPDGNHIPIGFTSTVNTISCKLNTPSYWCMPENDASLATTVIKDMVNDYDDTITSFKVVDANSLEVMAWENKSLKINTIKLGARPFGINSAKLDVTNHDELSIEEAQILQTYLIERNPTLTVTYTVSLEQVVG